MIPTTGARPPSVAQPLDREGLPDVGVGRFLRDAVDSVVSVKKTFDQSPGPSAYHSIKMHVGLESCRTMFGALAGKGGLVVRIRYTTQYVGPLVAGAAPTTRPMPLFLEVERKPTPEASSAKVPASSASEAGVLLNFVLYQYRVFMVLGCTKCKIPSHNGYDPGFG